MPSYNDLRPDEDFVARDFARVFPAMTPAERQRCIQGLMRLKMGLGTLVPPRRTEANLLVASWNIKEFGHTGQRLPEAYYYIAEILSAFDLIAVQEIKSTLVDLDRVMRILGDDWRYMVNDITDGADGNSERSAYVYNTRRVELSGLAGEITLWDELTAGSALKQLKRAPYITGFLAGWKRFAMINLHLHPGDGADDLALRGEEVRLLLAALEKKRTGLWTDNLVLVGDMNLYLGDDAATVARLEASGYLDCGGLKGALTNVTRSQGYDRMFFRKNDYFQFVQDQQQRESGGVFDFFAHVYRDGDWAPYRAEMAADHTNPVKAAALPADDDLARSYFRHPWRKNQMSDHFPIWVELVTDDSAKFLSDNLAEMRGA
ncbi:endonuclease/exonuclease/phosphatase family protein [Roseisalinus antarcticus]|uniref:Endonuclease/Exonuclease/phosphatase family protein n=1 Tax=Roseisalinus antarcticus TaxID=254357 RepID=A0A1Y5SPW5_9RHOB|nr:endonuclease/exonuclease/phosphatase family protein [Roseisalinus antarcticus]SLN44418.1 Endonuclease/Exonuclease/phosphatase family protein [Roseisalinus antarcticus]